MAEKLPNIIFSGTIIVKDFFFLLYIDWVFSLTCKIINNKKEKEKKFMKVKLNGEKLRTVNHPNKKGARNIVKNLLLSNVPNSISLFLI